MMLRDFHDRRQLSQLEPAKIQLPTRTEGDSDAAFVVASLDTSTFYERSRACRPIAVHNPGLLVGQTIVVERGRKSGDEYFHDINHQPCVFLFSRKCVAIVALTFRRAGGRCPMTVLAHLPELGENGQHLLQKQKNRRTGKAELAYLGHRRFYTSGYGAIIEGCAVIAAAGTHTAECLACTEVRAVPCICMC
jgi:hypothetical protein